MPFASGAGRTFEGPANIRSTSGHGSALSPAFSASARATKVADSMPNADSAAPKPGHGPRAVHSSPSRASIHWRHESQGPGKTPVAFRRDSAHASNDAMAPS